MTFLNPLLLAGTALVAIPIVLHLVMRRQPRRLEFPALRFIQRRHEENRRRLRLRHLLLLLLRMGGIAILAFALARPSVKFASTWGSQEAPAAVALVFDTAPHMDYRQANQSRLSAAQRLGLWLLGQLPGQSTIAVLDARLEPAAFAVDAGAARQRIEQLDITPTAQPLPMVIAEALRLLSQSDHQRKELYVFTDLSRGSWPRQSGGPLREQLNRLPGLELYLIDVGVEQPLNYALGEARLSAQLLSARNTLRIETELSRTAGPDHAEAENRAVELYLLDEQRQPQKRSEAICALRGGEAARVEFRLGVLGPGTQQGFLRIVGQDGLAADDIRHFSVLVRTPWRVWLVAPAPAEQYALFLAEALAPTAFRKRGEARFDCHVAELGELGKQSLGEYDAVCLVDPAPLEPTLWRKLSDFAAEGGGVAIFLGRNARPVDMFNLPEPQELLPGKLLRQARRPGGECHVAPPSGPHPLAAPFLRLEGAVPWQAFPVFRFWELEPAPAAAVVLRLNDDSPLLWERVLGKGRVLTMATPVSDRPDETAWNLLPVGDAWPFVILMNQLAAYLVGSSEQQFNYYAGQTAVLPLDAKALRPHYVLVTPNELRLSVSADLSNRLLAITATEQPGNYRVQAGGTEGHVDLGFSVNLRPEQTELARVSPEEMTDIFGFPPQFARSEDELDRNVSAARVGRELFAPVILLLVVVLAAEHLLANRFYKE
jgi:hypothetical protein